MEESDDDETKLLVKGDFLSLDSKSDDDDDDDEEEVDVLEDDEDDGDDEEEELYIEDDDNFEVGDFEVDEDDGGGGEEEEHEEGNDLEDEEVDEDEEEIVEINEADEEAAEEEQQETDSELNEKEERKYEKNSIETEGDGEAQTKLKLQQNEENKEAEEEDENKEAEEEEENSKMRRENEEGKKYYYAVRKGRHVACCVFVYWEDCVVQVEGFDDADYKTFEAISAAIEYISCRSHRQTLADDLPMPPPPKKKDDNGTQVLNEVAAAAALPHPPLPLAGSIPFAQAPVPPQMLFPQNHPITLPKNLPAMATSPPPTLFPTPSLPHASTTTTHPTPPIPPGASAAASSSSSSSFPGLYPPPPFPFRPPFPGPYPPYVPPPGFVMPPYPVSPPPFTNNIIGTTTATKKTLKKSKTPKKGPKTNSKAKKSTKIKMSNNNTNSTTTTTATTATSDDDDDDDEEEEDTSSTHNNTTTDHHHPAKTWNDKFEELRQYIEDTGKCHVPKNHESLGMWASKQRQQLHLIKAGKPSTLTQDQVNALEMVGFEFQVIPGKKPTNDSDTVWEIMYDRLKKHWEEHGTSHVSNSPRNPLGNWVERQKLHYARLREEGGGGNNNNKKKKSILTGERIQRLNDLNFKFEIKTIMTFEERFEELSKFKNVHGHCRVPNDFNIGLSQWLRNQRRKYQLNLRGEKTSLTQERVQRLTELGMVWHFPKKTPEVRAPVKKWEERFEELIRYKEEHGTTIVPRSNVVLGGWCHSQRQEYKRMKDGKKSRMTPERAMKLLQIGFVFKMRVRRGTPIRVPLKTAEDVD